MATSRFKKPIKDSSNENLHSQLYEYGCDPISRTIILADDEEGEVNATMSYTFNCNMNLLENQSNSPINIRLNTSGGLVNEGWVIIDRILNSPCEINIHASGSVMSMGIYILAAGDYRTASFMTDFMHHSISNGFEGKIAEIEMRLMADKRVQQKMLNYLAAKTKMPQSFWGKEGKLLDHYFDAEDALKYGLIEEVK